MQLREINRILNQASYLIVRYEIPSYPYILRIQFLVNFSRNNRVLKKKKRKSRGEKRGSIVACEICISKPVESAKSCGKSRPIVFLSLIKLSSAFIKKLLFIREPFLPPPPPPDVCQGNPLHQGNLTGSFGSLALCVV